MKKITDELLEQINNLNKAGETDNAIGRLLGVSQQTVSNYLNQNPNRIYNKAKSKNRLTENGNAICSICEKEKALAEFGIGRNGQKREYRYSYCRACHQAKVKKRLQQNIESYLKFKIGSIKRSCKTEFDLDVNYLLELWTKQNGKCFYTDEPLEIYPTIQNRKKGISVDKIVPSIGYTKGNVVLASTRANLIKNDLTLEELEKWMPSWYAKLKTQIPLDKGK